MNQSHDSNITNCFFWGGGITEVTRDLHDISLNDGTYTFAYDGWGFIHPSGWESHGEYVATSYRRNSWLPNWLLRLCEKQR